jgi:cation diffusion facilitator CzcD-associated flavoprotein CzcO
MSTSRFELDCLIIGAGFGGCYQLKLLRDAGFKTKTVDAASSIGGVWAWNKYPGARVDVEMPYYGYSDPAIWTNWNWTERYPGQVELSKYFEHVAKVWDLNKDVELGVRVVSATCVQDGGQTRWEVVTQQGDTYVAKFLICGTGTSFKQHIPEWEGLKIFKGEIYHSSLWPDGVDIDNKRIAVIGAGSTGVQVVQEAAKVSSKVTHFIRSPNIALPMRQRQVSREELYAYKPAFQHVLAACRTTPSGLPTTNTGIKTFDISEAERRALWDELWERGGFNWSIGGLADTLLDKDANRAAYDYWAEKTRPRIKDPRKRDLLVPLEPPYYFGTKRPSLEQDYYEMSDRENVDITASPIQRFTATGIETSEKSEDFDIVAICTGYDAVTGGLMTMNIKGADGEYLHDKWCCCSRMLFVRID